MKSFDEAQRTIIIESIDALCKEAARIAEEHGFTENTIGEDIALMHSELSEALEDYRHGFPPNQMHYETTKAPPDYVEQRKPCGIPSELADCIIRIMHFSARHGIDLGKAITEKMAYNETRPYKHGNKKI